MGDVHHELKSTIVQKKFQKTPFIKMILEHTNYRHSDFEVGGFDAS